MRDLTGGDDDLKEQRPEHFRACADIDVFKYESPKNSEGVPKMEQPEVHIKNEPKFIDHAMPHHGCGYGGGDGLGLGGGGLGLLAVALLTGGFNRHNDGNNGGNCERAVFDAAQLSKLGTIEGQVPLVGAQLTGAIATSTGVINTNALQVALGQAAQSTTLALGTQAQVAGVKDAVQNGVYVNTIATNTQGEQTRALINANTVAALNAENTVLKTTLLVKELGANHANATHDIIIQNTNTANALALQQQQQQQGINRLYDLWHGCDQRISNGFQAFNFGSGALTATPTNTSTNNRVS